MADAEVIRGTNSPRGPKRGFLGLSSNVRWLGVVSFLNDLSSDMIFPFIPIFLTSVLGASLTFVGLVEGTADAAASILKAGSGWLSDRWRRRKPFVVLGYSLSAAAKPLLAIAAAPWHVLAVRFLDRVGKGARDAPRDALISFSSDDKTYGRAFGFHRAMDTAGAALGPLVAFAVLPFIGGNYRTLFLLSFVASFFAVLILAAFVREVRRGVQPISLEPSAPKSHARPFRSLGAPFYLFLAVATVAALGRASEAFLILKARDVGVALAFIPIIYFVFNITFALLSTPLGILADRVGKRNTFSVGLLLFAVVYLGFAFGATASSVWFLFVAYGLYAALTEGVGRAVVADLVAPGVRASAFGVYNAATGAALLPASLVFGFVSQRFGSPVAFTYGAGLALAAAFGFMILRRMAMRSSSAAPAA